MEFSFTSFHVRKRNMNLRLRCVKIKLMIYSFNVPWPDGVRNMFFQSSFRLLNWPNETVFAFLSLEIGPRAIALDSWWRYVEQLAHVLKIHDHVNKTIPCGNDRFHHRLVMGRESEFVKKKKSVFLIDLITGSCDIGRCGVCENLKVVNFLWRNSCLS
jgi:hypothetical protein